MRMDSNLKAKIAIISLLLFFLIWFLTSWSDSKKCDARLTMTRNAYSTLYSTSSIQKVVIRNGRIPYDTALDSVVIEDKGDLEEIRRLLNDRKRFVWQRRSSVWDLNISLLLTDGNTLELILQKFESEVPDSNSYRIYEECDPSFESAAMELAGKVVELIGDNERASR
jgi:hypothetical protein